LRTPPHDVSVDAARPKRRQHIFERENDTPPKGTGAR
jgi:hypothetical protein